MRELPSAGQLLAVDSIPIKVGGCAANVAINLAKQEIDVDVVGCVGEDPSADLIERYLAEEAVRTRIHRLPGQPTSKTVVLLIDGEDRRYVHTFGANEGFSVSHLEVGWLEGLDLLYLGGIGLLPGVLATELSDLLKWCNDRNILTVVDVVLPGGQEDYSWILALMPQIDYFLPNDDEARILTGDTTPDAMLDSLQKAGANSVIISLGENGAAAFDESNRYYCGTYPGEAIDPSGAGDAFAAGFIAAVSKGASMPDALRYASVLGVSSISEIGTTDGVFFRAQAEEFMAQHELEIKIEN